MAGQINLYNPELLPREIALPARRLGWVLAAGVLACLAVSAGVMQRIDEAQLQAQKVAMQTAPLRAESQLLQSRLDRLKPDAQLQEEVRRLEGRHQLRQIALAALKSEDETGAGGFATRLLALSNQSVDGLWLTRIDMTGQQVDLQGQVLHADKLPRWMAALGREPSLSGGAFEVFRVERQAVDAAPAASSAPGHGAPASGPVPTSYQFVLRSQRGRGSDTEASQTP